MRKTRVAIVGLGMAVQPHAESYRELADRVEVAYAYSPSESRRQAFSSRFPFPTTDSMERILDDDSVSAVSVLTPPNTHLEVVRRCAVAGKHVLLEKPLEVSADRCRAVVDICRENNVVLGVVLQHRFRPPAERLRTLLAKGELGELVSASASVLNWRPQSYYDQPGRGEKARDGGGVLLTQGIHTLDLFLSLAGMPSHVFAYARTTPVHRMETEDLVTACVRFENGALGSVTATTTAFPGLPEAITLIGTRGTAEIVGSSLTVSFHDGRTERLGEDGGGAGAGADPMAFPNDCHRALIEDFLTAIETGGEPRIRGEEALQVHCLIDAVLASADSELPITLLAT